VRVDRATVKEYCTSLVCTIRTVRVTGASDSRHPFAWPRLCVGVLGDWGGGACDGTHLVLAVVDYVLLTPVALCRSPWSNEYGPSSEDGPVPPPKLRKLQITANIARCQYLISSSPERWSWSAMTKQHCAFRHHTHTPYSSGLVQTPVRMITHFAIIRDPIANGKVL
jgi:hypothetical protein